MQGQGQPPQQRAPPPTQLRTRHVLWIFSGAFATLERDLFEQDLLRRAAARAGGETAASLEAEEVEGGDLLSRVTTADLVGCGLEPEFVGRIPVCVA